jgi:hypothetical protein
VHFFVLFYVFSFCVLCDVCFVTYPVLFVCICVLNNCHRVATQLQLNISYHKTSEDKMAILILMYSSHRALNKWKEASVSSC